MLPLFRLALVTILMSLTALSVFGQQKPELVVQTGHSGWVNSVAFSPDGRILASGSSDTTIKLWDVSINKELRTLAGHSNSISSVAFSPDGKTLASGSNDSTIKLWEVTTGQLLRTLAGHKNWISSVSFSPDGKTLASASNDSTIKLWDVTQGKELMTIDGPSSVRAVVFSPNSKTLASGSYDKTITLWDIATGKELRVLSGHSEWVTSVAFDPDGKTLASGSADKTIRLWDVATGKELRILSGHSHWISAVAFGADGKTIVSASADNTLKLWDVVTGTELRTLASHSDNVTSVAFGAAGKLMASGSWDKTIKLWDSSSGSLLTTLSGHATRIRQIALSSDGTALASVGYDKTIKLWNLAGGQQLRTLLGHPSEIRSVIFSPDGKILASGSRDKTIKLWDVDTGKELRTLSGHSATVDLVTFSPDGKTLASASRDRTIKLWDVASGTQLRTLLTDTALASRLAFSPDGKSLATRGLLSARLWDITKGVVVKSWDIDDRSTVQGVIQEVPWLFQGPASGKLIAEIAENAKIDLYDKQSQVKLATLVALDEKDWLAATPYGFFDGSTGGSSQVIWRLDNNTFHTAPVEAFFEQFYTPRLLARVLSGESVQSQHTAVDFSKAVNLPPLIRITSPRAGAISDSDTAEIVVVATDQGGGAEDIRLYQNGKLVSADTRQLTRETTAKTKTFDVTLLPGVNTFRATAFNSDRTEATPDEIKIELKAVEASSNLYILAIGLNEYKNTRYNLNYGRADAQAFADAVEQHGHGIFKQINKRVIFDADATRANIEAAFSQIIKQARPEDAFVFYYAGHGVMSESDDKNPADFYLVPYEVVRIFGDDGSLRTNGIAARNLRELLKRVRAQKQLIILDACESGGAVETIAMRGASEEKAIMQLARSAGVAVLASAGQDQVATEFSRLGHGVFTYALLKALSGEADGAPKDGKITIKELEAYINDQVPELTKLYRGKRQDPNSWTRGQDFPIAIR